VKRKRVRAGDLDGLACGGITAHPRLALALAKNPQSGQAERAFLLQLANHQSGEFFDCALGLLLVIPVLSARCAATCDCVIILLLATRNWVASKGEPAF